MIELNFNEHDMKLYIDYAIGSDVEYKEHIILDRFICIVYKHKNCDLNEIITRDFEFFKENIDSALKYSIEKNKKLEIDDLKEKARLV